LNAFAERFVESIKSECAERVVLLGEGHLRAAVRAFVVHYHEERPHQGSGNALIAPKQPVTDSAQSGLVSALADCSSSRSARQRSRVDRVFAHNGQVISHLLRRAAAAWQRDAHRLEATRLLKARVTNDSYERIPVKFFARSSFTQHFSATA